MSRRIVSRFRASPLPDVRRSRSRRWQAVLAAASVLASAGCAQRPLPREPRVPEHIVLDAEDRRDLGRGNAYADSLEQLAPLAGTAEVGEASLIALGYLERLRLGLGSPFRLIEQALDDRRFAPDQNLDLAWAILARTHAGAAYHVDPSALDWIGGGGNSSWRWIGEDHLDLIDSVVSVADDPRAAELLLRFAYRAAAAEGLVSEQAPVIVAATAALIADRVLAMRDARALLRAARADSSSAIGLAISWRENLVFGVERPPLNRLAVEPPTEQLLGVPALVERVRSVARPTGPGSETALRHRLAARPLLDADAARRLAILARRHEAPPQAPIVAILSLNRELALNRPGGGDVARRARFIRSARNEELFAAEHALAVAGDERTHPGLALSALRAIVALRPFAQEDVWLPGDGGPTALALRHRFGFRSISFDAEVPTGWRPYYLRMLAHAAEDLQRVLPGFPFRGLGVHFGASPLGANALASHSPRSRTLFLPPESASGTLAHELAHDLDWQAISRGEYATDRAIRAQQQQLATLVSRLPGGPQLSPERPRQPTYGSRPTEVFARSMDWFVAATLAQMDRSSGYLSTVQDALLTGYTLVPGPDRAGEAGTAIVELISRMTEIPEPVRTAFLVSYGRGRTRTSLEEAEMVLGTTMGPEAARVQADFKARSPVRDIFSAGISAGCGGRQAADSSYRAARQTVLDVAATAAARGLLRRWAAAGRRPDDPPAVQALRGVPWSEERVAEGVAELRDDVLRRALANRVVFSGWTPECIV